MNIQTVKKTLEVLHCTDSRLPEKTTRPVGNRHLDSLRGVYYDAQTGQECEDQEQARDAALNGDTSVYLVDGLQLQPVGLIKVSKKQWVYVWGQGRLQRIRDLYEEGFHSGNIDVLILEGIDPGDRATLSMLENSQRSPNKLNDYYMMEELRKANKMISYTEIYNMTGVPVGTLKALDREFGNLPVWTKNAMLKGEITESVAKQIGKAGTDTQKELKEKFIANGRALTSKDVKVERQAVQQVVYANLAPSLFPVQSLKEWYSRDELLGALEQMIDEADKAVIEALLNQPA